jgi:rfaE bifunctional protein kinase chain/domain/rfaE bifunctional protein nucleotidyltransferase chain/domain
MTNSALGRDGFTPSHSCRERSDAVERVPANWAPGNELPNSLQSPDPERIRSARKSLPRMDKPSQKIRSIDDLAKELHALRESGRRVVHCHGVFDLLHIGHIKHLEAARRFGDILAVTVTPDRFVNKGPHRPAFPERLRAEAIASLACVDFVAINEWPSAVEIIQKLRPTFYVKGMVRESGKRDHSDAIEREEEAVKSVGGQLLLTDEETYSASVLINRFMDVFTPETKAFLQEFRGENSPEEIVDYLQQLRKLKVLIVGETIVDEYQFCSVLGKSGKEPVLAALHNRTEQYPGGVLAIANHVSNFCDQVTVFSAIGEDDSCEQFIRSNLNKNVQAKLLPLPGFPTIIKRRFLEEYLSTKLFEVYVMRNEVLPNEIEAQFCQQIQELAPQYDVVIVADYGHGLMTERAIQTVCSAAKFLAVNTQSNAGNKGFNTISKYPRADYVSIGEPEVRLDTRQVNADLQVLTEKLARKISTKSFLVTRGSTGCSIYDRDLGFFQVPAFAIRVVDRVGAGDAVLGITAPCVALGVPPRVLGFIANVVGAEACTIMGNRSFIEPSRLFRHITSLMK